jgi:hypothetical protein
MSIGTSRSRDLIDQPTIAGVQSRAPSNRARTTPCLSMIQVPEKGACRTPVHDLRLRDRTAPETVASS